MTLVAQGLSYDLPLADSPTGESVANSSGWPT